MPPTPHNPYGRHGRIGDEHIRTKLFDAMGRGSRNVPGPSELETDYTGNPVFSRFRQAPSVQPPSLREQTQRGFQSRSQIPNLWETTAQEMEGKRFNPTFSQRPPSQAPAPPQPASYSDPRQGSPYREGTGSKFQSGGMRMGGVGGGGSGSWGGSGPMPSPESMPPRGGSWSVWQSNATNVMNTYQSRPFNQDDLQKARDALGFLNKMGPVMEKLAMSTGKLTDKQEKQVRVFEKAVASLDRAQGEYDKALQGDERISAPLSEYGRISKQAGGTLRQYFGAYRMASARPGFGGQFMNEMGAIQAQAEPTAMELMMQGGKTGRRARQLAREEGGVLSDGFMGALGAGGQEFASGLMRSVSRGMSRMWMGSSARGIFSNPVFGAMDYYSGASVNNQMALMQSGAMGSGGATGMYANVLNRASSIEGARYSLGEQAYQAWGRIDPRMNSDMARGVGGMAQAILGPSIATGVQLGIFNPAAGVAAGVGQAIAGGIGYTINNATNYNAIGQVGASRGQQNLFNNSAGAIGGAASYLDIGINGLLGRREYAEQALTNVQRATAANFYGNQGMGIQQVTSMLQSQGSSLEEARGYASNAIIAQFQQRYTGIGTSDVEIGASRNRMTSAALRSNPNLGSGPSRVADSARWMEQYGINNYEQLSTASAGTFGQMGITGDTFGAGINAVQKFFSQNLDNNIGIGASMERMSIGMSRAQRQNYANAMGGSAANASWFDLANQSTDVYSNDIQDRFNDVYQSTGIGTRSWRGSIPSRTQSQMAIYLGDNDYYNANRMTSQFQRASQYEDQLRSYGMGEAGIGEFMDNWGTMSEQRSAVQGGLMSGNQRVFSQQAGMLGNIRYQTMDTATGMGAFYGGVSGAEYNWLRQDSNIAGFQGFRLNAQQAAGGQRAWQSQITQANRGMEAYQYQQGRDARNVDFTMTTGGQGLSSQSASLLGRGLESLAEVFQKYGVPFSAGNGMSQWQIQDKQTDINRQQQMFQMQQSGQYLGINQAQFDMTGRHFNERFAMNQQQFRFKTGFQRNEMITNRSQQLAQEQWQREDMAFSRDQSELGFAWSMQDYDRDIRYARGRQKKDLMRGKSREVIKFSMQMGQMDKQEERFGTQTGWSEDAFNRQREYFEQNVQFQEQEMEMQRRHFEENRSLDRQRLDLQRQSHEQQLMWMREEWQLQDQSRLLERQSYMLQFQMQSEMDEKVRANQLAVQMWSDAISAANDRIAESIALQGVWGATGGTGASPGSFTGTGGGGYTPGSGTWTSQPGSVTGLPPVTGYQPGSWQAPGSGSQVTQYAGGGYTGSGGMYEPAGVVHKGEYVTPQGGNLVLRGDNPKSLLLMERMVELLEIISENPTSFSAILQNPLALKSTTLMDDSRAVPARYA